VYVCMYARKCEVELSIVSTFPSESKKQIIYYPTNIE
jgi:hypothetical protein